MTDSHGAGQATRGALSRFAGARWLAWSLIGVSIVAMAFEQLLIAGAALIASHYVTSRVLKRHYQQVRTRLTDEDVRRRRAERIAMGQASILELIASGTSLAGIQGAIGTMVKEETDGRWWFGPSGLAGADPESNPMSEDLLVVVDRLMAAATERDRFDKLFRKLRSAREKTEAQDD